MSLPLITVGSITANAIEVVMADRSSKVVASVFPRWRPFSLLMRRGSSGVAPLLSTERLSPRLLRGELVFVLLPALLKTLLGALGFASSLSYSGSSLALLHYFFSSTWPCCSVSLDSETEDSNSRISCFCKSFRAVITRNCA